MKANEAKSKFVYPDKLYARTNDNITLDISYAPQTMEAVEYVRTDAFIEKACSGIEKLLSGYIIRNFHFGDSYEMDTLIEDFRNYMKGE